jgi:hypothetical protein
MAGLILPVEGGKMQEIVEETVTEITPLESNAVCDVCIAPAFVRVQLNSGNLDFCGHHYAEVEPAMKAAQYPVLDNRSRLSNRIRYIDMWNDTPMGRK